MMRVLRTLAKGLTRAKEMNRSIELEVREITYLEAIGASPADLSKGRTRVIAEPASRESGSVMLWFHLEGKREDIRIGQRVSCEIKLHDVESSE